MLFSNISLLDEEFKLKENMFVGVQGGRIAYIGKDKPKEDYGKLYNGKGKLLMSGFYNAHAHSPMTLLRGYGENMGLQDWLTKRIFPFEDKLDGNAVYWGTLLAMAESLSYGIVSTTDMYYFCDDMIRAIKESGGKNNISRGITNFSDSGLYNLDSFREMDELFKEHNNTFGSKIKVDMSLHAEYTSNEKTVKEMAEYVKSIGTRMHVHVSESKREHEECKERRQGRTPIRYLYDLGVLDIQTTAAHCIWVEEEDMDIMKEKNVTVACNPISNLKLASGVCNVPKLLKKGVRVAIGTDSVASNNSLNFFEEIKTFTLVSKEKFNDPTAVTPQETLYAATRAGALSQGRDDCGLIKEGYKADLIVLDISKPNYHPIHNMANNVVYSGCGGDIVLTMVDGEILYQSGEYTHIDIEKAIFEVEKATKNILQQL